MHYMLLFHIVLFYDDLHWKTANYLTNNYDNIFIVNLSTKDVINNETSNLTKMTKRMLSVLSLYKFRQRLEYKCYSRDVHYLMIEENYTSKISIFLFVLLFVYLFW